MRKTVYAASALSMLAALAFAAPAQAGGKHDDGGHHSDDALLSVLHGVPGLTVDVWVDGKLTLDDFEPGTSRARSSSTTAATRSPSRPRTPPAPTIR